MAVAANISVVRYVPATSKESEALGLRGRYYWAGSLPGDGTGGNSTLTFTLPAVAAKTKVLRWLLDYLAQTVVNPTGFATVITWTPWGDPVPRVLGGYMYPTTGSGIYLPYAESLALFQQGSPIITSSGDTFLTITGNAQPGAGNNIQAYGRIEDYGDHTIEPTEISKAFGKPLFVSPFVGYG